MIKNNLLEVRFDFLHLSQDDPAFAFNLVLSELRVLQDIREDFHHLSDILGKAFGVENRLFSRSVSIQMGSHVLNLQLDIGLRALSGSL